MPVFSQKEQIMGCASAVQSYYVINVQNKGQPGSRYIYIYKQNTLFFSVPKKTTRHRKKPEINHTQKNCDYLFWVIKFVFFIFHQPGKPWKSTWEAVGYGRKQLVFFGGSLSRWYIGDIIITQVGRKNATYKNCQLGDYMGTRKLH